MRARRLSSLAPKSSNGSEVETKNIPLELPHKIAHLHSSETVQIMAKCRKLLHEQHRANKRKLRNNGSLLATQNSLRETLRLMSQSTSHSCRSNSHFLERKEAKESRLFALEIGEPKSNAINLSDKKNKAPTP